MNGPDTETGQPIESLARIFLRFLRFGFLAWGGPIAQIAMIRRELVEDERWVTKEEFNRALGVYQALPGPEAHELCVYFGMTAGGRLGGFLAGLGFMLPGFILMFVLSWVYLAHGRDIPYFTPVFLGLQAAVGALILRSLHRIASHSVTDGYLFAVAVAASLAELAGAPFIATLFILGGAYFFVSDKKPAVAFAITTAFAVFAIAWWKFAQAADPLPSSALCEISLRPGALSDLFVSGLRSGLLTFGGAYTVIAFLQHDAVTAQAWLTNDQFLDGLALSGVLPAPLIIFSVFVGFVAGGGWGALIMTIGIFLPAFSFTLIGHRALEKLIQSERLHAFLDGVTAAVVGLMAVTTFNLLRAGIHDWGSMVIFAAALFLFYLWKARAAVPLVMVACGGIGALLF